MSCVFDSGDPLLYIFSHLGALKDLVHFMGKEDKPKKIVSQFTKQVSPVSNSCLTDGMGSYPCLGILHKFI